MHSIERDIKVKAVRKDEFMGQLFPKVEKRKVKTPEDREKYESLRDLKRTTDARNYNPTTGECKYNERDRKGRKGPRQNPEIRGVVKTMQKGAVRHSLPPRLHNACDVTFNIGGNPNSSNIFELQHKEDELFLIDLLNSIREANRNGVELNKTYELLLPEHSTSMSVKYDPRSNILVVFYINSLGDDLKLRLFGNKYSIPEMLSKDGISLLRRKFNNVFSDYSDKQFDKYKWIVEKIGILKTLNRVVTDETKKTELLTLLWKSKNSLGL